MPNLIQRSLDTVKEGINSLKNIQKDKREYKQYLKRIQLLPHDYKFVYDKITNYMWSYYDGGNGYDMIEMQTDLLELFEIGATEGKHVFAVTGEDVGAFCDDLLRNANTYTALQREKLNRDILNKLKNSH